MNVSCIALAGGKSTRLGRNKLQEVIDGKILLHRVLDTLGYFKGDIIIVASPQSVLPSLENYPRVRIVNDIYPGTGSLGGIYTGLLASKTRYNLVVACDMPFLNTELLRYMVGISRGFDLVAFHEDDRPEMLHSVYSKNCLLPMKSLIEHNSLRIIGILPYIKTRYLSLEEIDKIDPLHLSFFNINTEEDLRKAQNIASGCFQPCYSRV